MTRKLRWVLCWAALAVGWNKPAGGRLNAAEENSQSAAVHSAAESFVKGFNSTKAESVVAQFLPQGELIDETGTIHQGKDELLKLFTQYFAKFPTANIGLEIESIRLIGDNIAIEEGTRYISTKDAAKARVRYVVVRAKKEGQWLIASIREFNDEPAPAPSDRLTPLKWLIGEWVSEGSDLAVKISYRLSDDKNYLLADFHAARGGEVVTKSTQRIAWDPVTQKLRSWVFDADGGFAEGTWTQVDDAWVVKSSATLPEGTTGSATVTIIPKSKDQFNMKGTERIVGDERADDFEVSITRAPPGPQSKALPAKGNETNGKALPPALKAEQNPATKSPALPKR